MRYIKKVGTPTYFSGISTNLINNNRNWKYFGNKYRVCKIRLKKHILTNEQAKLCAYCEAEIKNKEDAHLEHIQPQTTAMLRFDYNNIIVSCQGKKCSFNSSHEIGHENESCGHQKSNTYDAGKFLDPTRILNIGDYFQYDNNDGKIESSGFDDEKAIYTIRTLNLDNSRLNGARKNAQLAIHKFIFTLADPKNTLINILSTPRGYMSFLKYYYKNFIS